MPLLGLLLYPCYLVLVAVHLPCASTQYSQPYRSSTVQRVRADGDWVDLKYAQPQESFASSGHQISPTISSSMINHFRLSGQHRPLTTEVERQRQLFLQGLKHVPAANVPHPDSPFNPPSRLPTQIIGATNIGATNEQQQQLSSQQSSWSPYAPFPSPPLQQQNQLIGGWIQPTLPMVPSSTSGGFSQLDRYDTGLGRFSSASAANVPNRVHIDPAHPALQLQSSGLNGATLIDRLMRHRGRPDSIGYGPIYTTNINQTQQRQLPHPQKTSHFFPQVERVPTSAAAASASGGMVGTTPPVTYSTPTTSTVFTPAFTVERDGGFGGSLEKSTLPSLLPPLGVEAKVDPRPASGKRLGPQGRFGGGTNEYREDLGRVTEEALGPREDQLPGRDIAPHPSLNQLAPNARSENYPLPPYESIYSWRVIRAREKTPSGQQNNSQQHQSGSSIIPAGGNYIPQGVHPLRNESASDSPAHFLDMRISPPSMGERFAINSSDPTSPPTLMQSSLQQRGSATYPLWPSPDGIRPYNGPEEVTRSRFRQLDEWLNEEKRREGEGADITRRGTRRGDRFVQLELLNE